MDGDAVSHATYQWEVVMPDGDLYKAGYGGSGIYISPKKDIVVAFFGSFGKNQELNKMPRVARQLVKSGLFKE